ncbi:hypothetical protein TeGR_g7399 [Tetraparma gracilis]|uniref:Uncharacterized protein n=1 Tax=Tetraparma gracilis TaxID=2962635 RepID=A0ABQ6M7D9_9STRA|nr:hypothetical protein TeGR_g7399 [Tetraparma gracilis]
MFRPLLRSLSTLPPVPTRTWSVYLSGEIHTSWRSDVIGGSRLRSLPVAFTSSNPTHSDSDDAGVLIQPHLDSSTRHWYDNAGAKLNLIRTGTLLRAADIVVSRFDGNSYRQWNAAYESGVANALSIPVITLHPEELGHPLKEVNAGALASCRSAGEVVDVLAYVTTGAVPEGGEGFVPFAERG